MGWTISHGAPRPGHPFDGLHYRTYTEVDQWADAVRTTLPAGDLNALVPLLAHLDRGGDPFELGPKQTREIAHSLQLAIDDVPAEHRELTRVLAAAAIRAASARQPWSWS